MDSVITSDKVLNSDIIVVIEDNNSLGIELSQKLPGKNILRVSKTQFSSYSDEYEEALKKFESIKLYTALSLPLDHPDRPYFVKLLRELEPEAKAPEVVEED
jgi:hypothetical protein